MSKSRSSKSRPAPAEDDQPDTRCAVLLLAGPGLRKNPPKLVHEALQTADNKEIGRTDYGWRPSLCWDADRLQLSATDLSKTAKFLAESAAGAIGYALLPDAAIESLTERRFRFPDDAVYQFERLDRPPFQACDECPCAYRRHLVKVTSATAGGVAVQAVRKLDDSTSTNLFVQPLFAGTRQPLSDTQLDALLVRSAGDTETHSAVPWGLLLPPVTYPRRADDGTAHTFDRPTVALRETLLDALPDTIRAVRAGAVLELGRDHLLNPALAAGGRIALKVLVEPTLRTDVVVEHPATPSARYARWLLGDEPSADVAPPWVGPAREALRKRATDHFSPAGLAPGQLLWEEREPDVADPQTTVLRFNYDTSTRFTETVTTRPNATRQAEWLGESGLLRGVAANYLALINRPALRELIRDATDGRQGVILGGFMANVAQLFFSPVSNAVSRAPTPEERWWHGGALLNALLTAEEPEPDVRIRRILELLPEHLSGFLVGEVSSARKLMTYPRESDFVRLLAWYVTPLDWRCAPIARLPAQRGTETSFGFPFHLLGSGNHAG